ncbi:MAG TPA: hypothetical protein VG871_03010, partial [Vicinamibacterales bacterium]|nr:hypothetical protein [Vicinamibacterales bacterium]
MSSSASAADDIVLYAATSTAVHGAWQVVADAGAAGGSRISNPDAGAPKIVTALAAPADYFELTFTPVPGIPYRLWMRGRAQGDVYSNDSVHVQFSGSVDATGSPVYRIGTTDSTIVNLEDGAGVGVSGWGWQDNGYGVNVFGPPLYFDGTLQTIRVQVREDGFSIDQIVLSPGTYMSAAPGALENDTTILPETLPADVLLHASAATAVAGLWSRIADPTAVDGVAIGNTDMGVPKAASPAAAPASYVDLTFRARPGVGYRLWIRGRAEGDYWGNDSVFVQFSNAVDGAGNPVYRIGTTDSTIVNLEDYSSAGVSGWGWQDNGYGQNVLGPLVYFNTTAAQTIRLQIREDGFRFDQIVLSSAQYLTSSPGALKNDTTLLDAIVPPGPTETVSIAGAPSLYPAITDTVARPEPPLPPFGP